MVTDSNSTLKDQFSVYDVSAILGVGITAIKNWESVLCLSIERNAKGSRRYSQDNINQLKEIKKLLSDGYTLKEIKDRLNQLPDANSYQSPKIEIITEQSEDRQQSFDLAIINKYETRLMALAKEKEDLHRQLGRLEGELSKYNEIISLKNTMLEDYQARLKKAEDRINIKWWGLWRNLIK